MVLIRANDPPTRRVLCFQVSASPSFTKLQLRSDVRLDPA
ncbi:hypothetical protein ABID19_000347 [Mesorhizobium robiniae]|uniref:Uncharacterized protein n=1 Tax=Mesorhizobium robiniae TaxID=559315 RepID=A0ABV2GGA9_9HYPH